jgi:hypothetical protein
MIPSRLYSAKQSVTSSGGEIEAEGEIDHGEMFDLNSAAAAA